MKNRVDRPTTKHTMQLFTGQFDRLQELHPRLGASAVIRELIDQHIRRADEGAMQKFDPIPECTLAVEEIL